MSFKPKQRSGLIAPAFDGVNFLSIDCKTWCRHLTIEEVVDEGDTKQGLAYVVIDDNYSNVVSLPAGKPIDLGNPIAEGNAFGPLVGFPAQSDPNGRTLLKIPVKVSSASSQPVQILVTEHA